MRGDRTAVGCSVITYVCIGHVYRVIQVSASNFPNEYFQIQGSGSTTGRSNDIRSRTCRIDAFTGKRTYAEQVYRIGNGRIWDQRVGAIV